MAASTTANLAEILVKRYEKLKERQMYEAAPLLALLAKDNKFDGESMFIPIRYTNEPGGSATFDYALANRGPAGFKRFEVTRRKDYGIASIETELFRAAKSAGDGGAVVGVVDAVLKGLRNTQKRSLCKSLYGNAGGARGQIASGHGSDTITLLNKEDIVWFEPGMTLDGATTDGTSGSVITGGVLAKIASVDPEAGTITNNGAGNWNDATGINGIAANNYLFRQGDFGLVIQGLGAWIPPTVTSTTFNGVNRTIHKERLGGCRITPTTEGFEYSTIEDAALALLERIWRAGGSPDKIFLHPKRYRRLSKELGSRRQYVDVKTEVGIGFKGIVIEGQGGECTVMSDPNCPRDTMWALTMDTWKLHTLGDLMGILDDDGNEPWIREGTADALQVRMSTMGNLSCDAPGLNGRADLSGIGS